MGGISDHAPGGTLARYATVNITILTSLSVPSLWWLWLLALYPLCFALLYRFFFWILLCSYIPLSLPSLYFFIPFSCLPSHPPSLIFCFPPLSASLSFFTSNPPTHRLRFHTSPFPAHSPSALHTFSSLFPLCRRHSEQFSSLLSVCLSLSLSFLFCLLPFTSASLHSPALSS